MTYTIEKNVPLPSNVGRHATYPYADMEVGDSFFVEALENVRSVGGSLRGSAYAYAKRQKETGKRFSVRQSGDGFRVWRTA